MRFFTTLKDCFIKDWDAFVTARDDYYAYKIDFGTQRRFYPKYQRAKYNLVSCYSLRQKISQDIKNLDSDIRNYNRQQQKVVDRKKDYTDAFNKCKCYKINCNSAKSRCNATKCPGFAGKKDASDKWKELQKAIRIRDSWQIGSITKIMARLAYHFREKQ